MHILITGSSGTIGTRLAEKLLERGDRVSGVDWKPNEWQEAVQKVTTIADLRSEKECEKIPTDVDIVIHLAANARVYELVENPDRARDNILTVFNMLEWCRKNGVKKFIFASSRETYGNIKADLYKEDMARIEHCESPYTASKIAGEALVESYARCYGIDHVTFRFSNVYGMYDESERVVPLFLRLAKAGKPLTIFGKDKCLDFTYIDDCIAGIIAAIDRFDDAKNDTYNLAYGEGTTILHVAERIKELTDSGSEIALGESRTGEVIRYIADISKAGKVLGYDPKIPLDEGIELAAEWYGK